MTQPEDLALTDRLSTGELALEAPDADAAEQAAIADPAWGGSTVSSDLEAPEWDAAEQSQAVPFDDEYR
jgi:hypothetical protein